MERLNSIAILNYIGVVFSLSLQQDFEWLEQQVLPFAHFFFFLPLSAKVNPVTNKTAVANKSTFFMIIIFFVINQRKNRLEIVKCQFLYVKYQNVAITVTPPCTTWFSCTFTIVPRGNKRSTRLPNLIKPISSVCLTF